MRIPSALLEAANVKLDQPIDIREENGSIVIEPIRQARYDIETLVAGITDDNRHAPIDTGPPTGNEIW